MAVACAWQHGDMTGREEKTLAAHVDLGGRNRSKRHDGGSEMLALAGGRGGEGAHGWCLQDGVEGGVVV